MSPSKQIHIIAGPNGAGKSSHARVTLLPDFLKSNEFVNADEIAKRYDPDNMFQHRIKAGKIFFDLKQKILPLPGVWCKGKRLSCYSITGFIFLL